MAVKEHRQIVEAIEMKDSELAEMLMRRHIAKSQSQIDHTLSKVLPK